MIMRLRAWEQDPDNWEDRDLAAKIVIGPATLHFSSY